MRIIFTGAQGTGKTTVLDHFRNEGYEVITEVVRNLAKEGVNINEMGDVEGQKKIFDTYLKLFNEYDEYISDRGLVDVLSYTFYLTSLNPSEEYSKLIKEQLNGIANYFNNNSDVMYFYFPIEFPIVDDGVRSIDEDFRIKIDIGIKAILEELKIPFYEVRGSVEERVNFIKHTIDSKHIS